MSLSCTTALHNLLTFCGLGFFFLDTVAQIGGSLWVCEGNEIMAFALENAMLLACTDYSGIHILNVYPNM